MQKKISDYFKEKVDIVLSDMAVNTTGNKSLDSIVTGDLCIESILFSEKILKKDGIFVSKLFMGSSFNEVLSKAKEIFIKTQIFKPLSSRRDSRETFIVCKK